MNKDLNFSFNSPKFYVIRFKAWGNKDPHRTAEDLAFSVARFFQFGGSFHNYYMVNNESQSP